MLFPNPLKHFHTPTCSIANDVIVYSHFAASTKWPAGLNIEQNGEVIGFKHCSLYCVPIDTILTLCKLISAVLAKIITNNYMF